MIATSSIYAHLPSVWSALRIAIFYRFVHGLQEKMDVFIAYQARLGLIWA
ncbi:hypothetical protein [Microcoleus sp. Pol12A6]